jgi:hypothetical protein
MGMKGQPFDPRDHEAFVREIDATQYHASLRNLPRGVIPKRRGMSISQSIAAEGVLYQSGIPFWIPPGDGGANGLNFTGTRGVFTLSAEAPMASVFNVLVSGGYCYLPAGSGGLATGGWYWFKMTDGTNGEVFAETYSGTGKPAFVSSPTALPNLSAGRITQVITEILGPSFIMPGGSLGPNGVSRYTVKWFSSSTAGSKAVRLRAGGSVNWWATAMTNTLNAQLIQASRGNLGVQDRQIGNRFVTAHGWDCGPSATTYSADVTTVDTSVDVTMTASAQIPANTDSIIIIPLQFTVQYGA